jgi:hypothetical protein
MKYSRYEFRLLFAIIIILSTMIITIMVSDRKEIANLKNKATKCQSIQTAKNLKTTLNIREI